MSNEIPEQLFRRLVLSNQYRMLALLDPENEGDWEQAERKAIEGWPVDDLPFVEEMRSYLRNALTKEDQRFVLDALNVFELLQDGIAKGLEPKNSPVSLEFPGFDGNNETKLMTYARYAVREERRFESVELSNADFNSHFPMIETYQRMIRVWEQFGRPYDISEELFDALISAQSHR